MYFSQENKFRVSRCKNGPQLDGTDGFEPEIAMFCKGGLVTEIIVDFSDFSESEELIVVSKKAEKFMSDKLKQMGFSHTEIGSVVGVNPAYQ